VIIGVASVIAMVGIAEGTKKQSLERLEALGSNLISVFPQRRRDVAAGSEAQTLKLEDVDLIRRAVPTASAVTGEVRSGVTVKYGSINERSQVTGGLAEIQQIRNVRLKEGRFFTEAEDEEIAKVCVLGFDIYTDCSATERPHWAQLCVSTGPTSKSSALRRLKAAEVL
jgi:putative ABC transport system permease protein